MGMGMGAHSHLIAPASPRLPEGRAASSNVYANLRGIRRRLEHSAIRTRAEAPKRAGEETAAFREAADRPDSKVTQAMVSDEAHPPVAESNVTDLEAVRSVSFMLRAARDRVQVAAAECTGHVIRSVEREGNAWKNGRYSARNRASSVNR
jgi:hypothetical protein